MRKECSEPIGAGRPHHDNLEVMTVKMKGTHDALTGESILRGAVIQTTSSAMKHPGTGTKGSARVLLESTLLIQKEIREWNCV